MSNAMIDKCRLVDTDSAISTDVPPSIASSCDSSVADRQTVVYFCHPDVPSANRVVKFDPIVATKAESGLAQVGVDISHGVKGAVQLTMVDGRQYAKKTHLKFSKSLQNELAAYSELHHGNIARLCYIYETVDVVELYTEYGGETLDHFLERNNTMEHFLKICSQIAEMLAYMHSCGWGHFDIRPQHIVARLAADGEPVAKLIGFGFARRIEDQVEFVRPYGTWAFMPPEAYKGEKTGTEADMAALGLTIYRMLTDNCDDVGSAYKLRKLRKVVRNHCGGRRQGRLEFMWVVVMEPLLRKNPKKRQTAEEWGQEIYSFLRNMTCRFQLQ